MTARAKEILAQYSFDDVITDTEQINFLLNLFSLHPEFEQKQGCGIRNIIILKALYNSKCFGIVRTDGTKTDISYISCIKGKVNKLENIRKACRSAVDMEVYGVRLSVNVGIDRCPFTDEVLTKDNIHIDHYDLKFADLFNKWIQGKDIEQLYLATNYKAEDLSFLTVFTDTDVAEDFRTFHNANTHLRAVSKTANLIILK